MKSIWKVMLAVCCLGMTIGCGTNPSKNENVKETLPALVVNGTQLMNTEGDTVVLHGCHLWLASVLAPFLQCLFGCLSGQ